MLSEPGASRSGNSSLVSSATRQYLRLVVARAWSASRTVHLWEERNGRTANESATTRDRGPTARPRSAPESLDVLIALDDSRSEHLSVGKSRAIHAKAAVMPFPIFLP